MLRKAPEMHLEESGAGIKPPHLTLPPPPPEATPAAQHFIGAPHDMAPGPEHSDSKKVASEQHEVPQHRQEHLREVPSKNCQENVPGVHSSPLENVSLFKGCEKLYWVHEAFPIDNTSPPPSAHGVDPTSVFSNLQPSPAQSSMGLEDNEAFPFNDLI